MDKHPTTAAGHDPDLRAAVEYALASRAASTLRAYDADWRHFTGWCDRRGTPPLPAAPETVAAYLAAHARGTGGASQLRLATLQRRLAGIGAYHSAARHPNPARSAEVQATWRGIRREHDWNQDRAAPAVTPVLRRLVATCDPRRYIGLRDRAMLLVGFAALLRRSELVALDVADLAPVQAGLAWRDSAGLTEGPAFRPVHPRLRLAAPGDPEAAKRRATLQTAPRLT